MKKLLILIALAAMYVSTSELGAKKKAEDFCGTINIGDPTGPLYERGIAAGARKNGSEWVDAEASLRKLFLSFTGYYPGSDFICTITEKNGVVIKKNILASSLL